MTGRRNNSSQPDSPERAPQSRRSERVRKKRQRAATQQIPGIIPGVRTEVSRPKRSYQFSGYPKLSSDMNGELETLMETAGLTEFYSCLDWNCPQDYIQDFLHNAEVVNHRDWMEIKYCPEQYPFPLVITVQKLARAFQLSLEGICESPSRSDKQAIDDVKAETRFQLDAMQKKFSLASAQSNALYIAGKFVSQALFLHQNSTSLTLRHMILFRAAMNGQSVAWGKVLFRNLVRRILSFGQAASGSRNRSARSRKNVNISYAAVVAALLLREYHGSEPDIQSSRPEGSYSRSNSDDSRSDRQLLIDVIANQSNKILIKEEVTTEEDPVRFAICNSTIAEDDAQTCHEQLITGTEGLEQGADDLTMRRRPTETWNEQRDTTNPVEMSEDDEEDEADEADEEEEEEVSIGESDADAAAEDETERNLEYTSDFPMLANTSDVSTEGENSAEFGQNSSNSACHEMEQESVDDLHQLSCDNDSPNAHHLPCRFNMQPNWLEVDVNLVVDSHIPGATEILSYSQRKLKSATGEPEEGPCAMDLEDALGETGQDFHSLHLEMVNEAGQMPTNVPLKAGQAVEIVNNLYSNLERGKKRKAEFVNSSGEDHDQRVSRHELQGQLVRHSPTSPRATLWTPPRLVTEIAQLPASTLVKMVHTMKHFLHGLDEAGVAPNVYLKLKGSKFMDALKFELENRDLQAFSEQTDFFGMDWSMDKIFDAHWIIQDAQRKSQLECLKLKEEVDQILAEFLSGKATNSISGKSVVNDGDADDQRTIPLFQALKILNDKMKDVKERIRTMALVQHRHRNEWLKQRDVIVQRWNDMKFQYSNKLIWIVDLEAGALKTREDIVTEFEEKLQRESARRSCCEVTITNFRDEVQHLKGLVSEKTDEIRRVFKERDDEIQAAKLLDEKFKKSLEELHMKNMDLNNALTRVSDLKQTAETMSDRLEAQNETLNHQSEEIKYLKEELTRWMDENSACKIEKEKISTDKRRIELQRMNQIYVIQMMEESNKELKGKLSISKDRVRQSDQLLELKDQESSLLKARTNAAEKKLQDCKRRRDMALDMVQKQRTIQDACKRQLAIVKEEHEKLDNQLDKAIKRECRLLQQLEEEQGRLEEGLLDQEHQDMWSNEEITETGNETATDIRDRMATLREEKKEILASASQHLKEIIERHKIVIRGYGEISSGSSAG